MIIPRVCWDPLGEYQEFGEALGLKELRAAYGAHWPREHAPGERVWTFWTDTDPRNCEADVPDYATKVGWLSLTWDPRSSVYWRAIGVYPAHQNQQHGTTMAKWSEGWCFSLGNATATALMVEVLDTNPVHLDHWYRKQDWQPAGEIVLPGAPISYLFALTRLEWAARNLRFHELP